MEIWKAVVVGIVQGLGEFLPISSSGHIALTEYLLGMREVGGVAHQDLGFEVVLHLGTLLSVLIFFRKSLWRLTQSLWKKEMKEERMTIVWLAVATVPAVIAFELWGDYFKSAYEHPVLISGLLLVTAGLLFVPKYVRMKSQGVGLKSSLLMGVAQAFAVLPGVSRSGSSIAAGLVSGVEAEKAAEFSFLMSIPAIGGGFLLTLKDRAEEMQSWGKALDSCMTEAYLWGALASAIVGLFAIYFVMDIVKRGKLEYFSYYLIVAGIAGMIYFSMA